MASSAHLARPCCYRTYLSPFRFESTGLSFSRKDGINGWFQAPTAAVLLDVSPFRSAQGWRVAETVGPIVVSRSFLIDFSVGLFGVSRFVVFRCLFPERLFSADESLDGWALNFYGFSHDVAIDTQILIATRIRGR